MFYFISAGWRFKPCFAVAYVMKTASGLRNVESSNQRTTMFRYFYFSFSMLMFLSIISMKCLVILQLVFLCLSLVLKKEQQTFSKLG